MAKNKLKSDKEKGMEWEMLLGLGELEGSRKNEDAIFARGGNVRNIPS
jgi:hypothetical protein